MTTNNIRGIGWMLLQCLVFSLLSVVTHYLSQTLPVAVMYSLSMMVALTMMLPSVLHNTNATLRTSGLKFYLLRTVSGAASMLVWFYALKLAPVTEVTAISFTTPLFTSLFAVLILKEKMGIGRGIVLIIGFIGAIIMLNPGMVPDMQTGALLALLTALLWSICDVTIKHQLRSDGYNTQIFYMSLLMSLITLPLALLQWQMPTVEQGALIIVLGLLFWLNFHCLFRAYDYADLTVVMPFDFSRVIYSSILATWLFGEHLDKWMISGSLIIVASTVMLACYERNKHSTN